MTQLVPAILASTAHALETQASDIVSLADLVSYDVMDGAFVSEGTPRPGQFPILPPGSSLFWHLMVHDPLTYLDECLAHPNESKIVAVHAEAVGLEAALERLRTEEVIVGLVLNPATRVADVHSLIRSVDLVQIMTTIPGAQGHQFLPAMLEKVQELKELRENLLVAIDGGADLATIAMIARFWPDYVAVGSALTEATDPADTYRAMERLVASAQSS
ncbi:hypothetical protein HY375_02580 [Candidatus Berkelbacteria bacterium]|nr:hypothetical protein [Candidatus Berkelbacteria bacterium]